MKRVINSKDVFFEMNCPSNELVYRGVAIEIIDSLSDKGMQVYGIDGGILRQDGKFEQKIDSAFSKKLYYGDSNMAKIINKMGIESIEEDPIEYNCYCLLVGYL
ncbi:hypothetical protein GWI72_12250 [Microvirga tunisiensis]|uniref:Uncharacterized protein n=1 Tax=Pannonibacter tanglangensis TaxID=2750084 RepID=A0A7X5F3G7_9HYPH|nr:hypothetical protein [Pannonibacter sp. XCT-53]NBN79041.1 hypothetical protein [Pannonibacter sp. XCT-53]